MITVSACLIVKNEEKVLKRCLECLKTIADEIVIVDTGSTDGTKETAAQYTDKIYDFEWIDDFSAARNYAFSLCTMDYIYSADADEIIDEENIRAFTELKRILSYDVEIVQMVYKNQLEYNTTYNFDSELRPKLYKRLRTFKWEGRVHEAVETAPVILDSEIEIVHKPEGLHSGRDFGLFKKAIMLDGGLSKRLRKMYARELAVSGTDEDFADASDYFGKAAEEETDEDSLKEDLYVLMRASRVKKDDLSFMKYSHRALAIGATSETAYELGEFYRLRGDEREAEIWYYNALHETTPILNIKYGGEYAEKSISEITGEGEEK